MFIEKMKCFGHIYTFSKQLFMWMQGFLQNLHLFHFYFINDGSPARSANAAIVGDKFEYFTRLSEMFHLPLSPHPNSLALIKIINQCELMSIGWAMIY